MSNHSGTESFFEKPYRPTMTESPKKQFSEKPGFQTTEMRVLAQLDNGIKKFESIQKNTNLSRNELNAILEQLEKDGLMQVKQKNGPFGKSIELYLTAKGTRKFHS